MSNSILTSEIRVPVLMAIEEQLPVLANGVVNYNKHFVGGNGTSIDILVPSYGNTVSTTSGDLTGVLSDVKNDSVSVVLTQYSKGISLSSVEKSLSLSSYEDQVAIPQGQLMASDIQKVAIDVLKLGAATCFVTATNKYTDIGEAIAYVEASRAPGDYFGVMSPKVAKGVVDSGLALFQADIKNNFVSGDVGSYMGTRFFKSQDMGGTIVTGAQVVTTGVSSTGYAAGGLALTITGATLTGTFKKGQVFNLVGVNSVDTFGVDTGIPYAITMQANATAAGNSLACVVKGMYDSGPLKNVTALPTTTTATTVHAQNSTYQTVLVWEKQAFVTASAPLKPLAVAESKPTSGKIMNLRTSVVSDGIKDLDIVRWDVLLGFAVIYRNRVSRCDIKIA